MTKFVSTHGVDLANLPLKEPITIGDSTIANVRFLYDRELTGDNEAKVYSYETDDKAHIKALDALAKDGYYGIKRADGTVVVQAPADYDKWSLDALKEELAKRNDGRPDDQKLTVADAKAKDSYVAAFTADDAAGTPA